MNWFTWFLVVWWLFNAVTTVATVGRPRKPLDASTAAIIVVIYALLIAGLILFGVK